MEIHTKSTQELIAQANSAYPHFKSLDSSASAIQLIKLMNSKIN